MKWMNRLGSNRADALPGRDEKMPVADRHYVNGNPLRPPFPDGMSQAVVAIEGGDPATAISWLERAITRTDGCALRGSPDGNGAGRDWITDCTAQADIYDALTLAVDATRDGTLGDWYSFPQSNHFTHTSNMRSIGSLIKLCSALC